MTKNHKKIKKNNSTQLLYASDRRKATIAQITASLGGKDAPYKVLKELWQNASDAGATKVFISHNDGVFLFQDNGKGIDAKGRISIMTYHRSSKEGIANMGGKHGTGLKKAIGLAVDQNYAAAQIVVESVEEGSNDLYRFTITLQFLIELNSLAALDEQGAMLLADKHTTKSSIPNDWKTKNGVKRTSGTDVYIYYVDMPSVQEMKKNLPKYLAPSAWQKVMLLNNGKKSSLTPLIFPGSLFETHKNIDLLGIVSCKLFVQHRNRGIILCDENNHHTTLEEIIQRIPNVSTILIDFANLASGWITIPNLNDWRGENSSLNRKFFDKPCERLVAYLELLKPQLDALIEEQKQPQEPLAAFKFSELTSALSIFSKSGSQFTITGTSNKLKLGKDELQKQEICLHPDEIIMPINSVEIFSIKNHGFLKLDHKKWIWDDTESIVKISTLNQGREVILESSDKTGKGTMILTHPDYKKGSGKISLPVEVIKEFVKKIHGPGTLIAGNDAIYKIIHWPHKKIDWKITSTGDWHREDDMVTLTVESDHIVVHTKVLSSKKTITLSAIDSSLETCWASKIIEIYPQMGNRDLILTIAEHDFLLVEQASRAGLDRPIAECLLERNQNLPVIYFDRYNVLLNSSTMNAMQQAINGIIVAALSYLVNNNSIDAKDIPSLMQGFLLQVNKKVNFAATAKK